MNDPDDLGIVDTSWLTDADWAVINRLRRIHETEGQKAVKKSAESTRARKLPSSSCRLPSEQSSGSD